MKIHYSTSEISSGSLNIHSKRSRQYPASENSLYFLKRVCSLSFCYVLSSSPYYHLDENSFCWLLVPLLYSSLSFLFREQMIIVTPSCTFRASKGIPAAPVNIGNLAGRHSYSFLVFFTGHDDEIIPSELERKGKHISREERERGWKEERGESFPASRLTKVVIPSFSKGIIQSEFDWAREFPWKY